MKTYHKALTIAGSDCSGGAGVQADLKTFSALGVYGMSIITALTSQNTKAVNDVLPTPVEHLRMEFDAIFDDIRPDSIKIGMCVNESIIGVIAECLKKHEAKNIILDPVMISTSGCQLIDDNAIDALCRELMPMCDLLTPNRLEAERIAGMPIRQQSDVAVVANKILNYAPAVLIKGGHIDDEKMTDYLFFRDSSEPMTFSAHRIDTKNSHGTGCTLSSAIAAYMALGYNLTDSVNFAKKYLTNALMCGSDIDIGHGHGPINHFWDPQKLKITNI